MRGPMLILVASGMLAGCAGRPAPAPVALGRASAAQAGPVAPTPINAGLSPAGTLWHLRTGLNVAALACRGPEADALVAAYNALLATRSTALSAAEAGYRAEYQARGGGWRDLYDDDQTRLYNFWSGARGRAGLCAGAGTALADLAAAEDTRLPEVAAAALYRLDRPFAPPRIEVDARALSGPGRVMVAVR